MSSRARVDHQKGVLPVIMLLRTLDAHQMLLALKIVVINSQLETTYLRNRPLAVKIRAV